MEDDQRKSEARRRRLLRKDALKKKRESDDHEGKQPHKWSDEEEDENEGDRGSDFDEEEEHEEGMEASDHGENKEAAEGTGDFSLEKGKKPCSEWIDGGEKKNMQEGKAAEARRMRLQRKEALKRKRGTLSRAGRRLPSRLSSIDEEETDDRGETIPTEHTSTGGGEQKLAARLKSEVGVVLGGIKDSNDESGYVMSEEDEENGGGGGEGNKKGQSIST